MTSAVLILPDAYRDAGNAFGVEQGWGENNFSVPLSPDGKEPVTHWGCRAEVTQSFIDMVENPSLETKLLLSVLIHSFSNTLTPYEHWISVLEENKLQNLSDVS